LGRTCRLHGRNARCVEKLGWKTSWKVITWEDNTGKMWREVMWAEYCETLK